MLTIVVGDDHTTYHKLTEHELVAQTEHIFIVGDAEVGTDLVLLDVLCTHHDDDLDGVAQLS